MPATVILPGKGEETPSGSAKIAEIHPAAVPYELNPHARLTLAASSGMAGGALQPNGSA